MTDHGGAPPELAELCLVHHEPLVRLLTLRTGSREAGRDLAQDTLERLCAHWEHVRDHPHPSRWIYRVALNLTTSRWRRLATRRRMDPLLSEPPAAEGPRPEEAMAVRDALQQLPPRERDALLCRFFLDLTVQDTAAVLRCPPNTVKTLTRRGLAQLRALGLVDDREEDPVDAP